MYKPYRIPVFKASPSVRIPEPKISKFVIFILRILGTVYYFFLFGTAKIGFTGDRILLDSFRRALAGESRCIIAFRHANGREPQLLTWVFLYKLKALAAKNGIRFARRSHAVFVYGYEVANWGGWVSRFFMSNLGALPIHHAKMDNLGMNRIYKAILDGSYPVAFAPEGQVSYTTGSVPRLEPGVIRIGFNAAERLVGKGEKCPVEILPLSFHFSYGHWGRRNMEQLLRKIEKYSGFSLRNGAELTFQERLRRCRDHLLEVNESRYQIKGGASLSFEERLDRVINAALEKAERMLSIKSEGDPVSRMYRLRQICWDRIFLPGLDSLEGMTQIERNTLDLQAGEAWYITRHQEIVDFCSYFRIPLPAEDAALHKKVEYVQNLWDFANRTMGGVFADRINAAPRRIIIQTAPVINLTERFPAYQKDKKAAIEAAMGDLEKAYLDSIDEANRMDED